MELPVSSSYRTLMTWLLPPLDHARSERSLVQRIALHIPTQACISAPGLSRAEVVALEHLGGYRVDAVTPPSATHCPFMLQMQARAVPAAPVPGWELLARERSNPNEAESAAIYRRAAASSSH